jgi:hypothetical protein
MMNAERSMCGRVGGSSAWRAMDWTQRCAVRLSETLAVSAAQDRAIDAFDGCEGNGAGASRHERDGRGLGALTHDLQRPVAAFETEIFNIGRAGF